MIYHAKKETIDTMTKYEKKEIQRLRKISILKGIPFELLFLLCNSPKRLKIFSCTSLIYAFKLLFLIVHIFNVFFKAHIQPVHFLSVVYTHKAVVPRFIGYSGYFLLILRETQHKAVIRRVLLHPGEHGRAFKAILRNVEIG